MEKQARVKKMSNKKPGKQSRPGYVF